MRTTCRLILGIAVFVAAAGVASAQQPDPQPSLPPLPETQVTPAPLPPDIVPPTEQTSATPVLPPIPAAPDLVVTATAKPVKKASSSPAKKPAQATASKKPIEKPATPESSSEAKEAVAAASVAATDSWSPPPPGAPGTANVPAGTGSPDLSQKAPPAVDPPASSCPMGAPNEAPSCSSCRTTPMASPPGRDAGREVASTRECSASSPSPPRRRRVLTSG